MWRPFVKALFAPKADGLQGSCSNCQRRVKVQLPYYLTDSEYTAMTGAVAGIGLALLLTVDVDSLLQLQLIASALVLFVGLVAMLTWTHARIK